MEGEREGGRDCVLGLKLAMIPPQGFARTCRDCVHVRLHREQVHTCTPTRCFLLPTLCVFYFDFNCDFFILYTIVFLVCEVEHLKANLWRINQNL